MESITLLVGMTLAFILGAYIRQPFKLTRAKPVEVIKVEPKEQEKIDEQVKQFLNVMNYNGKAQKDEN